MSNFVYTYDALSGYRSLCDRDRAMLAHHTPHAGLWFCELIPEAEMNLAYHAFSIVEDLASMCN